MLAALSGTRLPKCPYRLCAAGPDKGVWHEENREAT
jgi:hypothetical protein